MKTCAFKKAISIVCVLSMLLSLCIVSFVGVTSAAESSVSGTVNNANTIEYTLYNKGVQEIKSATPGTALPTIADSNFLGWFDQSLTTEYKNYPNEAMVLVAKYDGTYDNLEFGTFEAKPSNFYHMKPAKDPLDANNNVMMLDATSSSGTNGLHFALFGAPGATAGLKHLEAGKVYEVQFSYYSTGIGSGETIDVRAYGCALANIGASGGKTGTLGSTVIRKDSNGWKTGKFTFTYDVSDDKPYIIMVVQSWTTTAKIYIDNIVIKPYVAKIVTEDFTMDFEDKGGKGFEWSEDVNDYTYNSGNGYVTRGEIIENADKTNKYFKILHFRTKKGHHYFTVNSGEDQFKMIEGGIYSVEFDYFVEHSETPSEVCVYYVDNDSGAVKVLAQVDTFDYRDDNKEEEWQHFELIFTADAEMGGYTSLGIGVYNETSCPEEFATSVFFDNVIVRTFSISSDDALVIFDTKGGDYCRPMAVEANKSLASLPVPTRYGYNFLGWKYERTYSILGYTYTRIEDFTTRTTVPAGMMTVFAEWELKDGVIELGFKTNVEDYDAKVGTIVAYPGQPITNLPKNPKYEHQEFVGWYLDRNLTKALDVNSAPTESTVLYAKWKTDGVVVDYEDYTIGDSGRKSDRFKLITEDSGNKMLEYNLDYSSSSGAMAITRAMLQDNGVSLRAYPGMKYVVKFRYKIEKCKEPGKFYVFLTSEMSTWENYKEQLGSFSYTADTDGWVVGEIEFEAVVKGSQHNYMSIACNGNAIIFIDDVVVSCPENDMNIYGSAIRFNENGGKEVPAICGDPGDTINLPTPNRAGYVFDGWFIDSELTQEYTEKKFGTEPVLLYAKWSVGKFEESFEDYPASTLQLGISAGNSLYSSTAIGFDSSNIRSGDFSLFRDGATAGVKNFTLMRSADLSLEVGKTYHLKFWVKPTAISTNTGSITLMNMLSFTGISAATDGSTIVNYADLREGEWQQISYTFVASAKYVALATAAGCDMYIDDISITLDGYTGPSSTGSADTGDNSVSPIIVLAIVMISAGALLITGKKVFTK